MTVFKDKVLLHFLVDSFQFIEVGLVAEGVILDSAKLVDSVFQTSTSSETDGQNLLKLAFQPGSDLVGFLSKDGTQTLVV